MTSAAAAAWFSFTEVFDGHHAAFDRWHSLDHMPEQFAIEGVVGARRWTAHRSLPSRGTDPQLATTHHVHMYLLAHPAARALAEMTELAEQLAAAGRWFDARRGLLYAPFQVTGRWASPSVPVRAEILPYRPDRGAYVVVLDADHAEPIGSALARVPGVAGCWSFVSAPRAETPAAMPTTVDGTGIVLAWLETTGRRLADQLDGALDVPVRYARVLGRASPYQP